MLSRSGPLPSGPNWRFELKWDGFRAIISTEDGLRVRSRRGWDMTKNPNYWRLDLEREAMQRSRERQARTGAY